MSAVAAALVESSRCVPFCALSHLGCGAHGVKSEAANSRKARTVAADGQLMAAPRRRQGHFATGWRVVGWHLFAGREVFMKFILSALIVIATTLGCAAAERILMTRLAPSQSSLFVSNADGSGEQKLTEGFPRL
jgi:hypothetical protein